MIPLGYMAKHVMTPPDWLQEQGVVDICSVSHHGGAYFAGYMSGWKHNGYWLFDSPEIIQQAAQELAVDLAGTRVFYYEAYEMEFDEDSQDGQQWAPFGPDQSLMTQVMAPASKVLLGYDIVTYSTRTSPECSPLLCNYIATTVPTNEHCLLTSLKEAQDQLERGAFVNCEPGPYRILAVYSVPAWP